MNCSRYDLVLLPIPFTDLSSRKVRPAIVIGFGSFPGDLFEGETLLRMELPVWTEHAGVDGARTAARQFSRKRREGGDCGERS